MLKGEALWADHPKATNMAPWHPGASVCEFGGNLGQGDLGSIPGSGRSLGEGNGNLLQYSCLENPMDGAEQVTFHGVTKSRT